jgi:tetratricopeptide (TPR) repeat protein
MLLLASAVFAQSAPSPAEQKMAWARKAIESNPKRYENYNDLALALARRARETSDTAYYDQAEKALEESFRLAPDNIEGLRLRIWNLLGKHEFAKALEAATALNKKIPDDLLTYGFLTDANAELGNYEEAEKACQWMLDLRQGNVAGLTRAAYLREVFGDVEGAIQLMETAYDRTSSDEVEDQAWILTHVAHLELMRGKAEGAEKLLDQALSLFPNYHYALANMAKVRTTQKRYADAVELLRRRYDATPHPENLYALAEALERAGYHKEAERAYAEFEQKARAETEGADNSNRELIFYYANRARKPSEALHIARREIARRKDVHTLDAYAWALYVSGDYTEARKQIEKALAVGIRDAAIFYRAGAIAARQNDDAAATRYLEQSLEVSPSSEVADAARKELSRLKARKGQAAAAARGGRCSGPQ